ncbi:MAG: histidine phosphatase family protein [Gemmatimonadales bacterium]
MTTVLLVRHGVTQNAEGCALGWTDRSLAAEGRARITELAATWSGPPPSRCWVSDLARTRETAALLATHWPTIVESEPRLREMHFGEWDGRTWSELESVDGERLAAWMADWSSGRTPGGEGWPDLVARVEEWCVELRAGAEVGSGPLLVVGHAGSIRAMLGVLLDLPVAALFKLRIERGAVTELALGGRGTELVGLNLPAFPAGA